MINLLPKETTNQIRAGHNNVFLMKSITILGSITAFLVLASAGSYIYLLNSQQLAKSANNGSVINSSYQKAKSEADAVSLNISNSEQILNQRVSYSKLLLELAKVMPAKTTISTFSIDETSINQPITLKIYAATDNDADTLKNNLGSSSIFSSYSVVSTNDKQTDVAGYPIAITLTININKGGLK